MASGSNPRNRPDRLAVLIDRSSASASEIFAAAIQDYGRGLIIGEPSFGKGTVQTVIGLDQFAKKSKAQLGELKLTVAQFFRINGDTTQLRGVTPDIALPSLADAESFGESSFDNALPSTQIKAANYSRAGDLKGLLPVLLALHDTRVKNDKDFDIKNCLNIDDLVEPNGKSKRKGSLGHCFEDYVREMERFCEQVRLSGPEVGDSRRNNDRF